MTVHYKDIQGKRHFAAQVAAVPLPGNWNLDESGHQRGQGPAAELGPRRADGRVEFECPVQ